MIDHCLFAALFVADQPRAPSSRGGGAGIRGYRRAGEGDQGRGKRSSSSSSSKDEAKEKEKGKKKGSIDMGGLVVALCKAWLPRGPWSMGTEPGPRVSQAAAAGPVDLYGGGRAPKAAGHRSCFSWLRRKMEEMAMKRKKKKTKKTKTTTTTTKTTTATTTTAKGETDDD